MKPILPILFLLAIFFSSCSTARRVEPRRYQTLNQKATAVIQIDNNQYTIGCNIQLWRNEFILISVQPMLGIEMLRIEASRDSISIFDKMNRRYTTLSFAELQLDEGLPALSFKQLQDLATAPSTPKVKAKSEKELVWGTHKLTLTLSFSHREYNTLKEPKRLATNRYRYISLRDILPL